MTKRLGLISWATGILLLAATSACGSNDADPPPTTPATTSASTAPTTSASPTSLSDQAKGDATAVLRRYFAVVDQIRQSGTAPLVRLGSVATSTQLAAEKHLIASERAKGLRQTGDTKLDKLTVQAVNLDDSDPSAGKVPTVTIDVCWDVSGADLIDKNGKSAARPDRADRGWTRFTVANYHWAKNPSTGWRIASSRDLKQSPCSAS